jgi:hypothetical protein
MASFFSTSSKVLFFACHAQISFSQAELVLAATFNHLGYLQRDSVQLSVDQKQPVPNYDFDQLLNNI